MKVARAGGAGQRWWLFGLAGLGVALAQPSETYLLKVSPAAQRLTVWLGNAPALEFRALDKIQLETVSNRLKPGANTVRLRWQGLERFGDVTLRTQAGEVLFNYPLDDTRLPVNGEVRFNVVLGGSPSFAAARAPEGAPVSARLSVNMSGGLLTLTLNGQALGDFPGTTGRTLENVKRGSNTLKIRWSKDYGVSLPMGALDLKTLDGKRLIFWNTDDIRGLQGEETVTFRAP